MIYTIYATSKNVANGLLWVASIDFEMFACSYSKPKVMKAVTTLGRQLDGETFVFGPTLQVSKVALFPSKARYMNGCSKWLIWLV